VSKRKRIVQASLLAITLGPTVLLLATHAHSAPPVNIMQAIVEATNNDYDFHNIDLGANYPSGVSAERLIDDLIDRGFRPTFLDDPLDGLSYLRCGVYYIPQRPRTEALLRRELDRSYHEPYFALIAVSESCEALSLEAARLHINTL
jgi:hypothetical protein